MPSVCSGCRGSAPTRTVRMFISIGHRFSPGSLGPASLGGMRGRWAGAGAVAIEELAKQTGALLNGQSAEVDVFPARIAFNVIPQIDVFMEDGYTKEERKMMDETVKIMGADIAVTATAVRVPVFYGHSEAVNITFAGDMDADRARDLLAEADGICVVDDPATEDYAMPSEAAGSDPVWISRIRNDNSFRNSLHLWVVADNVRKGAALNAVQIAEILIR